MWITDDVDLPAEVVEAHTTRELVLFVGAGASLDAPSSLPSFEKLARDLATAARVPFDRKVGLDYFLGSMPADFDTHFHAHRMISRADSSFNPTHSAIVRVASAIGSPRIVTTNFDDHISSAALAASIELGDKWVGPALPLGDAFSGVVHLHGSVRRGASELILTDRDFGHAYLTDAWATRFLQKMFDKFAVLFIGYSHDDPIMRYLSLGLPSKTRRFVLTPRPDDPKWEHLGIKPIGYTARGRNHRALLAALEAWDTRARMGQFEHRARMKETVDGGPTLTPIDFDYLTLRLATPDGAREFAQFAKSLPWLRWIESLPEFARLFNDGPEPIDVEHPDSPLNDPKVRIAARESAAVLGRWFAATFVSDPALHGVALQTVQRLGQRFSADLHQAASWAAHQLGSKDESAATRWKTFLATSVLGQSAPPSLGVLVSHGPGDSNDLTLMRVALRPYLILKRRWYSDGDGLSAPDAEAAWWDDENSLTEHALRVVGESSPADSLVRTLLEEALGNTYDLLAGYYGERSFDPLSFGRSAIEPHSQDNHRDPVDALIDSLRDYGVRALPVLPTLPERWWSRGQELFQRLAVHLVSEDKSRDAEQKVQWILDRDILYLTGAKHEVFRLLSISVESISDSLRAALLRQVLEGPTFPDGMPDRDRHAAYSIYNLLGWLSRADPTWTRAAEQLARVQVDNPTFGSRDKPDFDHWSSGGTWGGGRLPIDPDDFVKQADIDAGSALDDLIGRDYSGQTFDEPTWEDALSVVRRAVEIRPKLGDVLWRLVIVRTEMGDKAGDLRRAIIAGWERADLGALADAATVLVGTEATNAESSRTVSQFLVSQIRKQVDSDETPAIAAMRSVAGDLWSTQREAFTHTDQSQSSFLSLNSWPGDLASYWVTEIDRRWRHDRDREAWDGLNVEERNAILALLSGPTSALDATCPALASEAFFLFVADPAFSEAHILPLFRNDSTADQAWGTFLYHPRFNDRMLGAGLLDAMVAEWGRLDNLAPDMQSQFVGFGAAILTFGGLSPLNRQRLLDQSVLASNGAHAPLFAAESTDLLKEDDVDGAEVWDLWLGAHVSARVDGLPRIAEPEELARWADAVPFVGDRVLDAIALLHGRDIGLGQQFRSPDIPQGLVKSYGSELVAIYAERVSNSSPADWLVAREVQALVEALRAAVGESEVRQLVDAARERGFPSDPF